MRGSTSLLLPALLLAAIVPRASGAQDVPANAPLVRVPALTPVLVKVDEEISSNRHKNGDRFRLEIAEDVRIGDVVVIPAGTPGGGEVVHASKSGNGGKAGELVLAARFVRVGDTEVPLRSMVMGGAGRDRAHPAIASHLEVGVFALFIEGGALVVPAGAVTSARTAIDVDLPAVENSKGKEHE